MPRPRAPARDPLADRLDVIEAVDRLFVATDQKDWKAVRACFAPRVHFDMTSLTGGRPATVDAAAIAAGWKRGLADVPVVFHQSGNHFVELTGDTAELRCYGIAFHYRPAAAKRVTTFVGAYQVGLVRRAGRWKIARFRYDKKFVE